jgi:hypothetical protein
MNWRYLTIWSMVFISACGCASRERGHAYQRVAKEWSNAIRATQASTRS